MDVNLVEVKELLSMNRRVDLKDVMMAARLVS